MIEAYAISVAATLEDDVTPPLLRIIDALSTANAAMLEFAANVRKLSTGGLSVARNLDKASAAATALGDSTAALTRASYVLDTMAASSADVARNLGAAKAEATGLGRAGGGGLALRAANEHKRARDSTSGAAIKAGAWTAAGLAVGGIYEYQKLQDQITRGVARQDVAPTDQGAAVNSATTSVMQWYRKWGSIAQGGIQDFGKAYVEGQTIAGFLPTNKERMDFINAAVPWAAMESKEKHVNFSDALQAFMEAGHQAGAQQADEFNKIAPALYVASIKSVDPLSRIVKASGYQLPQLTAAGFTPQQAIAAQIVLGNAGISSTKKGTWVRAFGLNIDPMMQASSGMVRNTKRNQALRALGLLDAKGHMTVLDKDGKPDMLKLLHVLQEAKVRLEKIKPMLFESDVQQAFLMQGAGAATILQMQNNAKMLSEAIAQMNAYTAKAQVEEHALLNKTQVSQAKQTVANMTVVSLNVGKMLAPATQAALSAANTATGWAANNPTAGITGMIGGAFVGAAFTKGVVWPITKFIFSKTEGLIASAFLGAARLGAGGLLNIALGGAASVAEAGVITSALGVAIAGAVGYGIGKLLNSGFDLAIQHITGGKESNLGGWIYDALHRDQINKALSPTPIHRPIPIGAPGQQPTVVHLHNKIELDGKTTAESVSKFLLPTHSRGPTTFNPAALPLSTGMTAGGM